MSRIRWTAWWGKVQQARQLRCARRIARMALTQQKAHGTPPFAPMSFDMQSLGTVMPPPSTNVDSARDMLRRAGLI